MPRGSKKRKAAKKKKENQSNPSSASAHSNDEENVMHHGEKDSDIGDVSTPGSQDHQNPLTDGEEEEIEEIDSVPDIPSVDGLRINESVGQVEREIRNEYNSDGENGSVEYDEVDDPFPGSSTGAICIVTNETPDIPSVDGLRINESVGQVEREISNEYNSDGENGSVEYDEVDDPFPGSSTGAICIVTNETPEKIRIEKYDENMSCVEKEAVLQSVEETDIDIISDQKVSSVQESDDRLTWPCNIPRDNADNRAQQEREYAVTEPLLVPSPCPDRKTSWRSCCGLFEVFSGSGR